MFSQEAMTRLQAAEHSLVKIDGFETAEEYVLHLLHSFPYLRSARSARGLKVLDLGCNIGYGTDILARTAREAVGADVSEKSVTAARKRFGAGPARFLVLQSGRLPFEDGEFDLLTSFQVIEHLRDYRVYLEEIRRVLRPDGLALFTTPNSLLRLDPGMKPWNRFHVREFDPGGLESLLRRYFPLVELRGLFAENPIREIELGRLRRHREHARKQAAGELPTLTPSLFGRTWLSAKKCLPVSLKDGIKRILHLPFDRSGEKSAARREVRRLAESCPVESLFYRSESLDSALELLAVCGERADAIDGFLRDFEANRRETPTSGGSP